MVVRRIALHTALLLSIRALSQTVDDRNVAFLSFADRPLRSVLGEIGSKAGIALVYQDDLVDGINVTGHLEGIAAESSLKLFLSKYDLSCKAFGEKSYVLFREKHCDTTSRRSVVIRNTTFDDDASFLMSRPLMIPAIPPVYPPEAARRNIGGRVTTNILVTKEGKVSRATVVLSSGSAILDSATVEHVLQMKFIAARFKGTPHSVWLSMVFEYRSGR